MEDHVELPPRKKRYKSDWILFNRNAFSQERKPRNDLTKYLSNKKSFETKVLANPITNYVPPKVNYTNNRIRPKTTRNLNNQRKIGAKVRKPTTAFDYHNDEVK